MLIDNREPRARSIGNLYLMPGVNLVDPKRWQRLMEKGFQKSVDGLINSEILVITDEKAKLTIEMVQKTFDVELLRDWEADPKHKGPLRGAIRKQIKEMDLDGLTGE